MFSLFNNLPLRIKLVLPTWMLMTCGIAALGIVIEQTASHKIERSAAERLAVLTEVTSINLRASLGFSDPETAHDLLKPLLIVKDFVGVKVMDVGNKVFTQLGSIPAGCEHHERFATCGDEIMLCEKRGIFLGKEFLGHIEVHTSQNSASDEREVMRIYVVLGVMFLSSVSFVFSMWLHRIVSKPLFALSDSMKSMIANDGFHTPIPITNHDEIGRLTDCFNTLMVELGDRERQLNHSIVQVEKNNRYVRCILDAIVDGVVVIDPFNTISYTNPSTKSMVKGFEFEGFKLHELLDGFVPLAKVQIIYESIQTRKKRQGIEIRHIESGRSYLVSIEPMAIAEHSLIQFEDITERVDLEKRRKIAEVIFYKNHNATLVVNRDQTIEMQNIASVHAFGVSDCLKKLCFSSGVRLSYAELKALLLKGEVKWERDLQSRNGQLIPCQIEVRILSNRKGRAESFVVTIADQTALREMQRLNFIAKHDPLTGLPNRAYAFEKLSDDHKAARSMHILFIDLDGFKAVNDSYGHQVGDELLKIVASRLRASLFRRDFVSRLAGDEFLVALYGNTQIERVVDRLIGRLNEAIVIDENRPKIGASIGVRYWDASDTSSLAEVIEAADKAMYAAKSKGKNRFVHC